MPSYFNKRMIRYPLYGLAALTLLLLVAIVFYNWILAFAGLLVFGLVFFLAFYFEGRSHDETEEYISTLSYRVKRVGEEALMEMPIGIMLINDEYYIEWTNPFLASCFNEDTVVGRSLYDVADSLVPRLLRLLRVWSSIPWVSSS